MRHASLVRTVLEGRSTAREEGKMETKRNATELATGDK